MSDALALPKIAATDTREHAFALAICAFMGVDPHEPISDAGHTVVMWVEHYDVPRVATLLDADRNRALSGIKHR